MRATERRRAIVSAFAVTAFALGLLCARAEPVADGRPTHLRLGGASDPGAPSRLPRDKLKVAWRTHVASALRGPAVMRAVGDGEPIVVADAKNGTLYFLGAGGAVSHKLTVSNQGLVGVPLRLADGTVVVVTGSGDVVGYQRDQLRFRVGLGPSVRTPPLALALDDGGFVLGIDAELVCFDGGGAVRGRASLSDRLVGALTSGLDGQVVGVTSGGMVVAWRPGGEVRSLGELGETVPGIVGSGRTVTTVQGRHRIVDLDAVTHQVRTRAESAATAEFIGGPLARPADGDFAIAELEGSRISLLTFPRSPTAPGAADPRRTRIATAPLLVTDAGAPPSRSAGRSGNPMGVSITILPDVNLVGDTSGSFAFTIEGGAGGELIAGIVDPATGSVTTLDQELCGPRPVPSAATRAEHTHWIAGLAAGVDELVVTCESGDVIALVPAGR